MNIKCKKNLRTPTSILVFTDGPSSDVLQQLQVPVVSEGECRRAFEPFKTAVIDSRVVCAGYLRGGKDACKVSSHLNLQKKTRSDKI